jgi:hypothetical protein
MFKFCRMICLPAKVRYHSEPQRITVADKWQMNHNYLLSQASKNMVPRIATAWLIELVGWNISKAKYSVPEH